MKRGRNEGGSEETKGDTQNQSSSDDLENGKLFYESRLAELVEEKESIMNGSHTAMSMTEQELSVTKDLQLKTAEMNKIQRIREMEALYDYEVRVATDAFENALNETRENLLTEVNDSIKKLKDLRDGVTEHSTTEVRASSRKLRNKRMDDEDGSEMNETIAASTNGVGSSSSAPSTAQGAGQASGGAESTPKPLVYSGSGPESLSGLKFFMTEESVSKDLQEIQKDWTSRAMRFLGQEETMERSVRVADGVLYFNEMILERDNEVLCSTEVTKESMYGTIQALSPSEVTIKLADGSLTRILLKHLRSGRCTISLAVDEE